MIDKEANVRLGFGDVGMTVYSYFNHENKDTLTGSGVVFHNIDKVKIGEYLDDYPTDKEIQVSIISSSSESLQVLIEQLEQAKQNLIELGK